MLLYQVIYNFLYLFTSLYVSNILPDEISAELKFAKSVEKSNFVRDQRKC